ncbi:MAG: HD domain-containing protein [Pirellulaceae bacterium]
MSQANGSSGAKVTGGGLPDYVLLARKKWQDGKAVVRQSHDEGSLGKRTVHALSDLLDEVLRFLHGRVCERVGHDINSQVSLVLHGGCGRREFAPFSDVDLMMLYPGANNPEVEAYARHLSQAINDTGMTLGFSVRSPREACSMALRDPMIFSSLTESRWLAGNSDLYENYFARMQRQSQRNQNNLVAGIIAAREKERKQFGETVYLLRPNVKRSRGALRDTHLIRWLGFVRFGETDIDQLCRCRALTPTDATQLFDATDFLLRLRCELHFTANRAQDGLGRNEQVRIAEKFGYVEKAKDGVLPVEAMMQDYFRYTSQVRHVCDQFSTLSRSTVTLAGQMLAPLTTRHIDGTFQIGLQFIGVIPSELSRVKGDLNQILRLMQLAVIHEKDIEHETWMAVREEMMQKNLTISEDTAQQFMALLENPKRLSQVLQMLHEMRALEKIIPAFRHARGLLQFNEYHKFTVDEHSLQAVRICTEFENDLGLLGRLYRNLRNKHLLHLALLLHDLGKGFVEEHCEVGRRISIEVCRQLLLSNDESDIVTFLVHNHLMMSHVAFHRDINDDTMVAEFASNVGSVTMLNLLFLLTVADISAVGPDMLTHWKMELLTSLYHNAHGQLTGHLNREGYDARNREIFRRIGEFGRDEVEGAWLAEAARGLPWNYCRVHSPEEIASQLVALKSLDPSDVLCWVQPSPMKPVSVPQKSNDAPSTAEQGLFELCIAKRERIRSGILYKVTGLLASRGFRTMMADIKPLGHSSLWYWFQFEDTEYAVTPPERLERLRAKAEEIAKGLIDEPPRFRKNWKGDGGLAAKMSVPEIKVEIDNHTVDNATIIDIFAHNKLGILYTITRKIFELGLDIQFARVATYGHQVLDVFYVTDSNGRKIRNGATLRKIQTQLNVTVREFLGEPTGE